MRITGLKFLYEHYIEKEDGEINRFDTLFKGITFDYIPLSIATIYAGKDALMTYRLFEWQYKYLSDPTKVRMMEVMQQIEVPLIPILADMYQNGVNINSEMLKHLYSKYNELAKQAEAKVYSEIDKYKDKIDEYKIKHYNHKLSDPINLGSPAQLSILFYNILDYKSKDMKTGVEDLEEINTDLTKSLIEYKKMQKLIDAFLVSLPKQIEPSTGKVHTSLNQIGAATGRFSSSGPNLQQIPSHGEAKEIRRIFGAGKGNILLSSDFSQTLAA